MTQADDDVAEMRLRLAEGARRASGSFQQRVEELRSVSPAPVAMPGSLDLTLADVGPGWRVQSTSRHVNDDPFLPSALGGICVEAVHDRTVTEDGEVVLFTRYRCLCTWRQPPFQWPVLDAGEVDLHELRLDRVAAWSCFCWLVVPVVTSKHKQPTASDNRHLTDAWRLWRALT